jgi:SAM-dependent methyltransferase
MTAASPSFVGKIPEYYDRCLGPAYFGPFARELAQRVPAHGTGDVLEIACGSGLVTKHLRARIDPKVRIVATDVSGAMIEYARAALAGAAYVEWREANAMQLPFDDGIFGAVVCGLGMMFMPDKVRALKESRRVLGDGGTLHFSVWDAVDHVPHAAAAAEVIEGLIPGDAELRFRIPYEMHDRALLQDLLASSGFADVRIDPVRLPVEADSARTLAVGAIRGTPRSALIEQKGIALDVVIDKLAARLAEVGGAAPYRSYAQALMVGARKAG